MTKWLLKVSLCICIFSFLFGLAPAFADSSAIVDLHTAVEENDIEAVNRLITGGANVNDIDGFSWSPLITGLQFGANIEVVEALINGGADVNLGAKSGLTPLIYASVNSDNPAVI